MKDKLVKKEIYIKPGFICFPGEPTRIYAVVGASIVVTVFDNYLKCGGMNHYTRPVRKSSGQSTPVYACPAIIGLLNIFFEAGSKPENLEAHIYGGAENSKVEGYINGLNERNIQVGHEILALKNIRIAGKDTGGNRGRKIVFDTFSGEAIIAKVDKIRDLDWYPGV